MPDAEPRDPSFAERRARFRALHVEGCFVLPNAWDAGSARFLASLGFQALATTSAGLAFAKGRADMDLPLDLVLDNLREIVAATSLPVNLDFEDGHAPDADGVGRNVGRAIELGAAGISIEDATGDPARPLYPLDEAVRRLAAARRAIDASGADVVLVGRAEAFLTGHHDPLAEVLKRLPALAEAGADCLYAPGMRNKAEIEAVVGAVAPKPVNLLVGSPGGLGLAEIGSLGVRRVSVGGALARAAWAGFAGAARGLAEGSFEGFAGATRHGELQRLFSTPR